MFTIKKSADFRDSLAILHKIADIPGGISVKSSILGGSVYMQEHRFQKHLPAYMKQ
jgi:lipoate synthase